jgi:hypothetical protein
MADMHHSHAILLDRYQGIRTETAHTDCWHDPRSDNESAS